MNDQNEITFKAGDPVLVLLGRQGQEWIEKAEVVVVHEDRLILRLVDRPGKGFLPVHARYVLHRCSACGQEPTVQADYVCMGCFYNDPAAMAWCDHTTPVQRFWDISPDLQAEHLGRGEA